MSTPAHPELLREIEAFCDANSIAVSRFGEMMMNDPRFVSDVRAGRELRRSTEAKLRAKMAAPVQPVESS